TRAAPCAAPARPADRAARCRRPPALRAAAPPPQVGAAVVDGRCRFPRPCRRSSPWDGWPLACDTRSAEGSAAGARAAVTSLERLLGRSSRGQSADDVLHATGELDGIRQRTEAIRIPGQPRPFLGAAIEPA